MISEIARTASTAVLIALLGTAVYTDLRIGKIYNALTLPCVALGIALNSAAEGFAGFLASVEGAGLVLVLYLLFGNLAGIGGGDTKLMMAVGALVGLKLTVWVMLFSAVLGGVMALLVMARHGALLFTTGNMARNLYLSKALRAPVDIATGTRGIKFRYSPAIALGTLLAFLIIGR